MSNVLKIRNVKQSVTYIATEYEFCACEYELTTALLDDGIFNQDQIKEILNACEYVLGSKHVSYLSIKSAIEDWRDNN